MSRGSQAISKAIQVIRRGSRDELLPSGNVGEVIMHNGHQFSVHTLVSPFWCAHCNNFIWGFERQCYRCKSTASGR